MQVRGLLFVLFIVLLSELTIGINFPTPLQTYVAAPDPSYSYSLATTIKDSQTITYVLKLTSQTWLTAKDVNPSVWQHWLEVVVPHDIVEGPQAGIYVDGGVNSPNPPSMADLNTVILAIQTKRIVARLPQIPNQPTTFTAEGKPRYEDAIIAYTWGHFFNDTSHPEWLVRLPMVKAVVRAMDAIQDFIPKLGHQKPEKFAIAGASKRGWVTWLTPAVDNRVNAIVPMVMPILNTVSVINQMWRSLGLWTFAFKDYLALDLMAELNFPVFQQMVDIEDPVGYMKYLEPIPKYMVFSTGDEFFLPDSASNFYNDLKGEFNLRMVPNSEHSLAPLDELVINNIGSFILYLVHGDPHPTLKEVIVYSNTTSTITVYPSQPPTEAKLWRATTLSSTRRDFRLLTCESATCFQSIIWTYETLKAQADGSYTASVSAPSLGWTGFLIELAYQTPYDSASWFQITSQVVIVPDRYPFPSCGLHCGNNGTANAL